MFNFGINDVRVNTLPCGCVWYFAVFANGKVLRWFTDRHDQHGRICGQEG